MSQRLPSKVLVTLVGAMTGLAAAARGGEKLKVVTTTTDLRSVVESVGGDKVDVSSLATGREDPHFIDAKPSSMVLAHNADLWARVGMQLEIGYERLVIDGSRNPNIRNGSPGHFDASEGVIRLEVPTTKVDRSLGDIHPLGNPHYWLDPLNMRIVAKNLARRLGQLRPADQAYFDDRLRAFCARLDEGMFGDKLIAAAAKITSSADQAGAKLWALLLKEQLDDFVAANGGDSSLDGWYGRMKPLRGAKIITYHRSWSYFANRFALTVVGELEPKPGIEPTASHLSELVSVVQDQKVHILLMEPFYSREAPDWLASKTGINVVQVANSVGGQPGATDYIKLIDSIVDGCVSAYAAYSQIEAP